MVVTDSSAHLPAELVEEYGIKVVPFHIILDGEEMIEDPSQSYLEFYEKQRQSSQYPTTSQPSIGDFIEVFNTAAPGDNIIGIFISSALSGTVQSACMARDQMNDRSIEIIDSSSASLGLGFQVLKACEAIRAKKDNVLEEVASVRDRMKVFLLVDNLDNLVRSGRLPKAVGMIGSWLNIKPVLTLKNGRIQLYGKVRAQRKGMQMLVNELEMVSRRAVVERVGIAHVDAAREAERLKDMIAKFFSGKIIVTEAGPAVGLHIGSGGLALIYY